MLSLLSTAARAALLPVASGPWAPVLVPLVAIALIADAATRE